MDVLIGAILEFFAEILFQLMANLFVDLGIIKVQKKGKIVPFWAALIFYGIFGLIVGSLSVAVFSRSVIRDHQGRLLNLWLTPVLVGFGMLIIGRLRPKKPHSLTDLQQFIYGATFAYAFGFIRYHYAWVR